MSFSWIFGEEGSGLYFKIAFNGTDFTVTMLEGAMDLNALWISNGDTTKDTNWSLPKKSSLNMDGTKVAWDDYAALSDTGLKKGQKLNSKDTYITTADPYTISLDALKSNGWGDFVNDTTDWSSITLGVRATSVSGAPDGATSIKYVAEEGGEEPTATRVFVIGEDANGFGTGDGAYAWFDTNNNQLLDPSEVNDTNRAYFSDPDGAGPLAKNIDFGASSYIVDFIGTGNANPGEFQKIDLSGFTQDDSIVVNFGKATGQGTANALVTISGSIRAWSTFAPAAQRGAFSNSARQFNGYTLTIANNSYIGSYTQRVDSSGLAARYQQYNSYTGFSGGLVKVGMSLKKLSLFATFANIYKSSSFTDRVIGGLTVDSPGRASNLAFWTSGTTINANQISVVWPAKLVNPGLD